MHTLNGRKQLLFRPPVLSPSARVAWEGIARPSLRASYVPVCGVHMDCKLVSGLCSEFLWLLPCSVEQLCGCERLGDCQLCPVWLATSQTLPSPLWRLAAGTCPVCFAVHLSQSWPQLQNDLAPFITPCVSCRPWLAFKLGFKRLLIISQEQSSWRLFWHSTSLGLRSTGWAEGQQISSCPRHAFHDAGVNPRNLQLHPTLVPASPALQSS